MAREEQWRVQKPSLMSWLGSWPWRYLSRSTSSEFLELILILPGQTRWNCSCEEGRLQASTECWREGLTQRGQIKEPEIHEELRHQDEAAGGNQDSENCEIRPQVSIIIKLNLAVHDKYFIKNLYAMWFRTLCHKSTTFVFLIHLFKCNPYKWISSFCFFLEIFLFM